MDALAYTILHILNQIKRKMVPVGCQEISPRVDQYRLPTTWLAVPISVKSADERRKCSDAEQEWISYIVPPGGQLAGDGRSGPGE